MVTDYDCWREGHDAVTIEEIVAVLHKKCRQRGEGGEGCGGGDAAAGPRAPCASRTFAVLTQKDAIPAAAKERLGLAVGKVSGLVARQQVN